tara:strand:- start:149 stop:757 length:609 start_codon:yes stop_codon:yes gene_type:complete
MSFGLALPTCYESVAEYLDVPLNPESIEDGYIACTGWGEGKSYNEQEMQEALSEALPAGFDVVALTLEPKGGNSLQETVISCGWRFDIPGADANSVEEAIERTLQSSEIETERKKKNKLVREDIRYGIHDLRFDGQSERGPVVIAELSAKPRVIRPSELVDVLAPGTEMGIARRTHQWIEHEGQRQEPLLPSTSPQLKEYTT